MTPAGGTVAAAAAHAFVADVEAPEVDPADLHHLERVLRLRPGQEVTVSDGAGAWRRCRVGRNLALEPTGPAEAVPRPEPTITVAFAPGKGDRPEWAVQKLTELGVDRVVPVLAARSVVRWSGERAAGHVERLRRVAREAAMQSRRTWLPVVEDVSPVAALADRPGAVLAAAGGLPPSLARPVVVVGPEGGWADSELALALPRMHLGPLVLRSETAAVASACLLGALRAGLVLPAP